MNGQPFTWTDGEVRAALGLDGRSDVAFTQVSTDTRTLGGGALFVALVGERFDGHAFLGRAAEAGALGAVVSRDLDLPDGMVAYRVDDTLVALGDLARHRRSMLPARVVGITGSSGKTSTKEFLRAALEGTFRVHATRRNLNNRVGLPLTLLDAPEDAEVVVAEMGTSEPGEIRELARIGRPDVGVVLTVSESHLDRLGDLAGVMDEKLDMIRGLAPEAAAVVGDTPPELPVRARELRPDLRVAGMSERADPDLRPGRVTVDSLGRYGFQWQGGTVSLAIPGRHMAYNATVALAVAGLLGVPAEAAARGVSAVRPVDLRGEERRIGPLTVLVDCYNANPQSTRAALETLAAREGGRPRMAFLGSMLELGSRSDALHGEVLEEALSGELELVVATGTFARVRPELEDPRLVREADPQAALQAVLPRVRHGGTLLLKASRGVALERLLPALSEALGAAGVAAAEEPAEERGD